MNDPEYTKTRTYANYMSFSLLLHVGNTSHIYAYLQ